MILYYKQQTMKQLKQETQLNYIYSQCNGKDGSHTCHNVTVSLVSYQHNVIVNYCHISYILFQ